MSNLEKRFPRYSQLIKLYPASYRKTYGEQMLQTLADMLDNAASRKEKMAIWLRTALDLPVSAMRQQLILTSEVTAHETPEYVKLNSIIGALLLLPFVLALLANALDKVFYNQTLHHSWLWRKPAASLWVIWLPRIATVLVLTTLAVYLYQQKANNNFGSWLKQLFNIRRTWSLLLVAAAGVFIIGAVFGHDKVQCILKGNFNYNWNATWQCIKNK